MLLRLLGVSVVLLLAGGIVWGRCVLSEDRQTEALAKAAAALDHALVSGDTDAWQAAEAAYGRAARGSLLDSYPLWVLELIRAWRAPVTTVDPGPLADFLAAVRARAHNEAATQAANLEPPKARQLAERLVNDLRYARRKRDAARPKLK